MLPAAQIVRVSELLQDLSNVRWSTTMILQYLNDAQRDFARSTALGRKLSGQLAVSPTGAGFYVLPADFLEVASEGVWTIFGSSSGQNIPLRPISVAELGGNWDQVTGDPPTFYMWPDEFNTAQGGGDIRVWPKPTDGALWTIDTAYAAGVNVVNGANVYVCTVAGTGAHSGGPTGTNTSGIVDNTATWGYVRTRRVVTLYYNYLPIDLAPVWVKSTAYLVNQAVNNGGKTYICITAGTSAARGGPTTTSADITDGTVHWSYTSANGLLASVSALPQQYHIAFVYWAVAMCYLQDSQYKDPSKSQLFMGMYKRELVDAEQAAARRFDAAPVIAPFSNV